MASCVAYPLRWQPRPDGGMSKSITPTSFLYPFGFGQLPNTNHINMPNYWMHRITGGDNASGYAKNILFDLPGNVHFLSIGWSDFSKDSYAKEIQKNGRVAMSQICQYEWKVLPRNRFNLSRFVHEMKPGDIVVVPLGKSFTVCEILDDVIYTNENLPDELQSAFSSYGLTYNGQYLYDKQSLYVDLGYYRKVKIIESGIPRDGYAKQNLYSAMKNRCTNAQLYCPIEVDDAIESYRRKKPIDLKTIITDRLSSDLLSIIRENLQDAKFEILVEWYLQRIGAKTQRPAKNSCPTEDGDADIIASFENLNVSILVQVKKHAGQTDEWAVHQICNYSSTHSEDDSISQLWVVSSCDSYSEKAEELAAEKNVRLIDGKEFAALLLEVGINRLSL